jgi:N-acetylneuraminate synthase/N,N'-diacetyllegionaminate synthase
MQVKIDKKIISENSPVFIVAEIGLNHNGRLDIAKELIYQASICGVDAVKFQTYKTENFINKKYAKEQYEILKKYELSFDDFVQLKEFAEKNGLIFFSSPFDFESADFLFKIKVPVYKVASSELSNIYFLKYLALKKLPIFISTGLHTFCEIKNCFDVIYKINKKIVLLYCASEYPLKIENANLNSIKFLKEKFKVPVGFSDHSEGNLLSIAAVCLGAKVIEKHFTLDKSFEGPDHKISLSPVEMKSLVEEIRKLEKTFGKYEKLISKSEKDIKKFALKGIYAKKDIPAGIKIGLEDILLQRPCLGIPASDLEKFLGKKIKRPVKSGEPIKKVDF